MKLKNSFLNVALILLTVTQIYAQMDEQKVEVTLVRWPYT